ncbi:MAG: hypothetical protein MZV63_47565 [Marinilabiliales bacterium]|nr:hypothetical protein [Marinilabiliales bacterium]
MEVYAETLEENALLRYDEQQFIATVKGVSLNYTDVTDLDTAMWDGDFILQAGERTDPMPLQDWVSQTTWE